MNFLPQTTIRLLSGSQTDGGTEEEMEISHLAESSAAPSPIIGPPCSAKKELCAYVVYSLHS